jgi:AraC-like DNA-binding protein
VRKSYAGTPINAMHKTLNTLYYRFVTMKPLSLILYGIDTPHDPGYVVDRPGPRQEWIILCFRTPFQIRTERGLEIGQPGDCVVHDANYSEWHTALPGASEGFRNDWLHLRVEGVREQANRFKIQLNRRIPTGFTSFLGDHLRTIADEDRRRNAFWQERIAVELETILLRIGRAQDIHTSGAILSGSERAHLEQFTPIRSTMLDHFSEPWSLKTLAATAKMSPNRFSVLYSLFFKISPIEELIQHRLQQSCTMLVYSDSNLDTIAEACGFMDAPYFSRVFKQRMGCSPGVYRKMGAPRLARSGD